MGLLGVAAVALASLATAAVIERDTAVTTGRYCDATQRTVCLAEFTATTSGTVFRIGLPEVSKAPFDTLVQVVAPVAVGWAGLAWGGSMAQNPLTVAWMNGDQGVVSSRWATGHTPPAAYAGATYSLLSAVKNDTHWQVNLLCTGCSNWATASLDPGGVNKLGFATSSRAPAVASSNTSAITIHNEKGSVSQDLSLGKVDSNAFRRFVLFLTGPSPSSSSSAAVVAPSSSSVAAPSLSATAAPSSSAVAAPSSSAVVTPPARPSHLSTTIIRPTWTAAAPSSVAAPPSSGAAAPSSAPQPPATHSSTPTSVVTFPPTTIGRPSTTLIPPPVRTTPSSISRPTTIRSTPIPFTSTSHPVTVTVTVTAPPSVPTVVLPPGYTTTCYVFQFGRPYRYCATIPVPVPVTTSAGDDDGEDDG